MKPSTHLGTLVALGFIFIAGISHIGNSIVRTQSIELSLAFFAAFSAYLWVCWMEPSKPVALLLLGLAGRAVLLFSLPSLSDDYNRFLWDGHLSAAGISPFGLLPKQALELGIAAVNEELFNQLNSPDYFTVYPPLNQSIFELSVSLGNNPLTSREIISFKRWGPEWLF
jgi:alpha-1,6-mannosyltransferase